MRRAMRQLYACGAPRSGLHLRIAAVTPGGAPGASRGRQPSMHAIASTPLRSYSYGRRRRRRPRIRRVERWGSRSSTIACMGDATVAACCTGRCVTALEVRGSPFTHRRASRHTRSCRIHAPHSHRRDRVTSGPRLSSIARPSGGWHDHGDAAALGPRCWLGAGERDQPDHQRAVSRGRQCQWLLVRA